MAKTIDEIARLAGVSVTSVRLVINGQDKKYRIGEKTRERIQGIIDEHGYIINQTARSLKLQRSETLGLVVPRLTNPFFSSLTEKLERDCRNSGYQLITVCSYDDDGIEGEVVQNLLARGVDGLFVTSSSPQRQKELSRSKLNTPVVFLDRDFGESIFPVVATDNESGGELLGQRLATLGRELFFLGADYSLPTVRARLRGLTRGLQQNGYHLSDNEIMIRGQSVKANGYAIMRQICQRNGKAPGGIVSSSLPILEGAMRYLREHYDTTCPDMVIGSFDDHSMLEFCPNHVIAMKQDASTLSQSALALLKKLINQECVEQRKLVIPPEIIIRNAASIG